MRRRMLLLVTLLLLLAFATTVAVQAKTTKYTFNDVNVDDDTVVEIEASVKITKKNEYSNCSYYSDDYGEWLGNYQVDESAGDTAEAVLDFCVANFGEAVQ